VIKLSVIVPARDEEACLGATLERAGVSADREVIVVDGESRDRTAQIAREHGARVIRSSAGRGRQLDVGARVARGSAYLFLHADTLLPPGFDEYVDAVLASPEVAAGAFRLKINESHRSLRLIEHLVEWRSSSLQMPYGDQAIFVRADTYWQVGGFPDIPSMEDFEFIRRVRRVGRIQVVSAFVEVSARRWLQQGIVRTSIMNQISVLAYVLGISPRRIASWRT